MKKKHVQVWLGKRTARVDPPVPDPPPLPPPPDDALARAQYEAESARAEVARMKRDLDQVRGQLPTDEQRARYAELEAQMRTAEEERLRKAGEFDAWRQQINEKHANDLAALRTEVQNALALAAAHEQELNDTLIGLAFSGATDWFGLTGKTVLIPAMAQSYFSHNVAIEVVPGVAGARAQRRVIVKDNNGTTLVDPANGRPLPFDKAIGDLIEAHPQKNSILKGSGRVGSGSAGGANGGPDVDLSRLRPADFNDPAVRERVRSSLAAPGGLQIGPGFDRLRKQGNKP